jgi:hypothetical protein
LVRRINYVFMLTIALIGFASFPVAAQSGRTFYIDYAGGSNSNSGASNSAPWKTHPYMQTSAACTGTGTAPAYSHQAGDRFIFKGGVTWPAACFGMLVSAGGSSSSAMDYHGVDVSWFAGASFTRPVFDLAGKAPTSVGMAGAQNVIYVSSGAGFVTFDNLEIKGMFINGGHSGPSIGYDCAVFFNGSKGNLVKNGYFHGWTTSTAGLNAGYSNCAGGIGQSAGAYTADSMTIEDSAGLPVPFGGCFANPFEVKNSTCHDVGQGVNGYVLVHDSQFYNISDVSVTSPYTSGTHTNVIQQTFTVGAGAGAGGAVYNNLIRDNHLGQVVGMCPSTDFYNNVMWNNTGAGADILVDTGVNACTANTSTVANIYNNTVDCSNGVSCLRVIRAGQTIGTLNVKNNHWITNSSPVSIELTVAASNLSNNITMSSLVAASQGYTASNILMPTSSSGQTVNSALNLASLCTGTLGSFCSDRLHVPRSLSWDVGAYQFGAQSQSSKPNPPSNLAANVQ